MRPTYGDRSYVSHYLTDFYDSFFDGKSRQGSAGVDQYLSLVTRASIPAARGTARMQIKLQSFALTFDEEQDSLLNKHSRLSDVEPYARLVAAAVCQ